MAIKALVITGLPRCLSPGEVKALLEAADDAPIVTRLAVRLLLATGARVGELAALRICDLDLSHGTVRVTDEFIGGATSDRFEPPATFARPPSSSSPRGWHSPSVRLYHSPKAVRYGPARGPSLQLIIHVIHAAGGPTTLDPMRRPSCPRPRFVKTDAVLRK